MYPIIKEKSFLKFLGQELILHQIDLAEQAGFDDFLLVSNPQNIEKMKDKVGDKAEYAIQEEPKGMADALLSAEDKLNEHVLIIGPNDVFEPEAYSLIYDAIENGDEFGYMLAKKVENYFPGGYLKVDQNNLLQGIEEKPGKGNQPSDLVNLVFHYYRDSRKLIKQINQVSTDRDDEYEVALDNLVKQGEDIKAVSYEGNWIPIKYPWHILSVMQHFLNEKKSYISDQAEIADSATIKGDVIVESGAKVMENSVIKGPCYIGNNVVIGNNSLIRDNSHIGSNTVVGYSTEVKNSYIGQDCWFHNNYIGDSVVMDGCSFGSGSTTANFRFDEKNIQVEVKGDSTSTDRQKFGCIMGEDCKTGINSSLMPGVKIGPNSIVGPHVILTEDLESDKLIKVEQRQSKIDNKYGFDHQKKDLLENLVNSASQTEDN